MRFHTFNKRIMIYDVPRNFIGDTHWRGDEAVQDGDELQLEKGVLVQVGEAIGSIEQDLTALFEKKRQKQAGSPGKTTSPPRPTLLATAGSMTAHLSQRRPKSLNALLGTPRGPHGRATVSTKSPYEHRQPGENDNIEDGRAFKRQRLDSRPNWNTDTPLWVRTAGSQGSPRDRPIEKLHVASSASKSTKDTDREIIKVDSSDEDAPAPLHVTHNKSSRDRNRQNQHKSSPDTPSFFLSQSPYNSPSGAGTACPDVLAESLDSPLTTDKQAAPVHTASRVIVNPLRIVSRKPRKKLMYKDLLPQRPPSRGDAGDRRRQASEDGSKILESVVSECAGTGKDFSKLGYAEKTPKKARSRKGKQQAEHDPPESSEAFRETDRGINVATSGVPLAASKLARKRLDRNPNTSITVGVKDMGPHMVPLSKSPTSISEPAPYGFTKAPARTSYVTRGTSNTDLEPSELDKILLARPGSTGISASSDCKNRGPKVSEPNTSPKDPPITSQTVPEPIHSELENINIPPRKPQALQIKPTVVPQPQLVVQSRPQRVPSRPPPPLLSHPRSPLRNSRSESDNVRPPAANKAPPPKGSLQKATSDMTGLRSKARDAVEPVIGRRMLEDKDLGPWSHEAFDLFGWIPEGKGEG